MKLKLKIQLWLYKNIRIQFAKLERSVLQAYEYDKAERARKRFRDGMTPEKYKFLTSRPNPNFCTHLKGGQYGNRFSYKDYAILVHTFPDAHIEVKCMICGKLFDINDPETRKMIESSTNSATASEVPLPLQYYKIKLDNVS